MRGGPRRALSKGRKDGKEYLLEKGALAIEELKEVGQEIILWTQTRPSDSDNVP